jgi:hypothetical protein
MPGATVSSAGNNFAPGRLWSLWELMKIFDSGKFAGALAGLSGWHQSLANHPTPGPMQPTAHYTLHKDDFGGLIENVELLIQAAEELELNVALSKLTYFLEKLKEPSSLELPPELTAYGSVGIDHRKIIELRTLARQICEMLPVDLSTKMVMSVAPRAARYLTDKTLFGEEVFNAFPSANEDIAEAGACLALERGTACVMHLMRALEAPLRAFSVALGQGMQNDWGSYIRVINDELDRRAKLSNKQASGQEFFSGAAVQYQEMKRAWRNPSMHLANSYSVERAEEIFITVRSFMRHLATKLSEQQP